MIQVPQSDISVIILADPLVFGEEDKTEILGRVRKTLEKQNGGMPVNVNGWLSAAPPLLAGANYVVFETGGGYRMFKIPEDRDGMQKLQDAINERFAPDMSEWTDSWQQYPKQRRL